jgi:hypothetical protein
MNDSQMSAQMGGGDEVSELARLLPPPAAPEMPARRALALRAHLVAEVAETRRGPAPVRSRRALGSRQALRSRRPGWLAAGLTGAVAVGAAAAVAVTVWMPASPGGAGAVAGNGGTSAGTSAPSAASLTAVTLLAKVADAAARQPQPKVSDSEFVYVRSEVAFDSGTLGSGGQQKVTRGKLHERQIWLPVTDACSGLLIENGQRITLGNSDASSQPTIPGACAGTVNAPTYRFLQQLPTDPKALLSFIYAKTSGEGKSQGRDGEAFITIGDMMREMIVPPKTAAALYRAAALIPGVQLVQHATNALGRPGIAVSFRGQEWIFDPTTYQFIGERDGSSGETAILQQAFVAKAGQLPKR